MPPVSEEVTVQPTDKAASGPSAFDAARADVAKQSKDQAEPPVKPDDTSPPPTPPAEQPPVEDQPLEATAPNDELWTPEELAKLTKQQQDLVRKMQGDYTRKTQKLSADRKDFEQWKGFIDTLQANPDQVIEELAKRRGLTISRAAPPAEKSVTDAATATLAQLPPELQFLQPVFEEFGKTLLQQFEGRLKPVVEAQTQMISETAAAETLATMEAFKAKYPDWEQHESKMVELAKKIVPTVGGQMRDFEYMELLYRLATAGQAEAEKTKKVIERINKSVEQSEQRQSGVSPEQVEHVMPEEVRKMNRSGDVLRAAFAAAKRGEAWTK